MGAGKSHVMKFLSTEGHFPISGIIYYIYKSIEDVINERTHLDFVAIDPDQFRVALPEWQVSWLYLFYKYEIHITKMFHSSQSTSSALARQSNHLLTTLLFRKPDCMLMLLSAITTDYTLIPSHLIHVFLLR